MAESPTSTESRSWVRGLAVTALVTAIGLGVAWAGGQGGVHVAGLPLMVVAAIVAFAVQWLAFVPSYLRQTEHYYDLTGSLTYQALTWGTLIAAGTYAPRPWLLAGLVAIWSGRLGVFLFRRVRAAGKDGRFDDVKTDGGRFLMFWSMQGLWVVLTMAAALSVLALPMSAPLGILDGVGLAVWGIGFAIEVVADRQKSRFKADPAHDGRFIDRGLWAWSRHPNYFGEITLWVGVALIALGDLAGWRLVTLISPVFVFVLIRFASGVPMVEKRADERWGDEEAYQEYKAKTPMLVPRPPR